MGAQADDILRATRRSVVETREDTAVLTAHPNARDQSKNPVPGYFESTSDAATVLTSVASLVGAFRRRVVVNTEGIIALDPLTEIPTMNVVDSELNLSGDGLVTRFEVDLEEQQTNLELIV